MKTDGQRRILFAREKAMQINLNPNIYGTFAEIGAGQEVAAQFFQAGLASGSIAKTMSAYDMTFSDAIYGNTERYVSRERLNDMLEKEYNLLTKRLSFRADRSNFFVLANTIATSKDTEKPGHGWLGVRFQLHPNAEPNNCILHILLKDPSTWMQRAALGAIGVNLLYGCFFCNSIDELIVSLKDHLRSESLEVDMFKLEGPDFSYIDNRLVTLKLVKNDLTKAAMFGPEGNVLQASEALYNKDVLLLRGRFKPVTHVSVDMMIGAIKQFKLNPEVSSHRILPLSELTLKDLTEHGTINEHDFLDRVDILCSLGQHVLISNYVKYYKLRTYISECNNQRPIGIIVGYNNLIRIFDIRYYEKLRGGLLEAIGLLFGENTCLYVYPCLSKKGTVLSNKDVQLNKHQLLFRYLYELGKIVDIPVSNTKNLSIISDHVLTMIKEGDPSWESCVPHKVARAIKEKMLFDYSTPIKSTQTTFSNSTSSHP